MPWSNQGNGPWGTGRGGSEGPWGSDPQQWGPTPPHLEEFSEVHKAEYQQRPSALYRKQCAARREPRRQGTRIDRACRNREAMERLFGGTDKLIVDSAAAGGVVPYLPLDQLAHRPQTAPQAGGGR
jgi:hypothetical protein